MTVDEHTAFLVNFTIHYGNTCFGFSSHFDTTLQQDLAPSVLRDAITVVALRHPVHRFISEFKHTRDIFRHHATISNLLEHFHGFNIGNHMTLQLAGE